MPHSLKVRLKKCIYKGILQDKDMSRLVILPTNPTNGDIIKTLFPDLEYDQDEQSVGTDLDTSTTFSLYWWNQLYKGGNTDESHN